MPERPPTRGVETDPATTHEAPLPEQTFVAGAASEEEAKAKLRPIQEKAQRVEIDNSEEVAAPIPEKASPKHTSGHKHSGHPGNFLGFWGFLIGKAWSSLAKNASLGGGESHGHAPAKKDKKKDHGKDHGGAHSAEHH